MFCCVCEGGKVLHRTLVGDHTSWMPFAPEIPLERTNMQTSVCTHTHGYEGFVNATEWRVKTDHYEEEGKKGGDEASVKVRKVVK